MPVDLKQVYRFVSRHPLGVLATVSPSRMPEAAVIGIASTEELEIVFDTVKTSRKYANLKASPNVALAIGWEGEVTVQYEGTASELDYTSPETSAYLETYFRQYPDGRKRLSEWPDIVHFVVTPRYIKYSDFEAEDGIFEFRF